jgi:hypothetical protein
MAFIVVPAAVRSTNALAFPVNGLVIPANANSAMVQFDMPNQTERTNSSQHMDFGIEVQIAPSTSWKPYIQAGWNGSTQLGKNSTVVNPAPFIQVGGGFFAAFAGERARVSVKLKEPMTLGGTISSTRV